MDSQTFLGHFVWVEYAEEIPGAIDFRLQRI